MGFSDAVQLSMTVNSCFCLLSFRVLSDVVMLQMLPVRSSQMYGMR